MVKAFTRPCIAYKLATVGRLFNASTRLQFLVVHRYPESPVFYRSLSRDFPLAVKGDGCWIEDAADVELNRVERYNVTAISNEEDRRGC